MTVDQDTKLHFNGIDGASGSYLFDPMSSTQIADVAKGTSPQPDDKAHTAELRARANSTDEAHFGVKQGIDPTRLDQAGWGVVFPAVRTGSQEEQRQKAIREALAPLLSLRKRQATAIDERFYQEYYGPRGYRPKESKQEYLARLGAGPGPADPLNVPYYLLIVGSPHVIPYHVQYQIDVQYAVGRIDFDTLDEYANYARSVVAAETGGLALSRDLAMVGVSNPDDRATQLSRKNLIGPLAKMAEGWGEEVPGWSVHRYFDDQANKAMVSELLGGPKTPALLFTASHGMGFPKNDSRQRDHQGGLLLQDWPGPKQWRKRISEDFYLSGDDIASDANLLGLISFNFACYGAGTPQYDEFSKQAFKKRVAIAEQAFVSGLHRRMLGHPRGGALASIGHVERAWGYSFMWGSGQRGATKAQLAVFESTLRALMEGMPVGAALEYFNQRYAEMASDLSQQLEELEWAPDAVDAHTLATLWTSSNDARGYAVVGDPAVRLAFPNHEATVDRGSIDISSTVSQGDVRAKAEPGTSSEVEMPEDDDLDSAAQDTPHEVEVSDEPGKTSSLVRVLFERLSNDLQIRTYVSADVAAASALDRTDLAAEAEMRAFTRITLDGEVDVLVPRGGIDDAEWTRHTEMVERVQRGRADLVQALLQGRPQGCTETGTPDQAQPPARDETNDPDV